MKVSAFILIVLAVSTVQSFIIPTKQPSIERTFNATGATVRQINPSANRMLNGGYINFPNVTKITPTKVSKKAIETAYITVEV